MSLWGIKIFSSSEGATLEEREERELRLERSTDHKQQQVRKRWGENEQRGKMWRRENERRMDSEKKEPWSNKRKWKITKLYV